MIHNKLLKGWYFKMTTKNKKCNDNCACSHVDAKQCTEKTELGYGFYSNVLQKPFEKLEDLKRMEEVYFAEQKAKENKVAQKKADAQKVEDAFKALNAARKIYKEKTCQLTQEYADALANLKKVFEVGKKDIRDALSEAEDAYAKALKEFTDAHPEGYHVTLRDGDFETTISHQSTLKKDEPNLFNIFDLLFSI